MEDLLVYLLSVLNDEPKDKTLTVANLTQYIHRANSLREEVYENEAHEPDPYAYGE